jgi:hypothetical protein
MDSYSTITIEQNGPCHKLSCKIHDVPLTPLRWLKFVDVLNASLETIGKNDKIKKFFMYFDLTQLSPLMSHTYYGDIVRIFKSNFCLFIDKLLGTFIYIDNGLMNILMNVFLKFYTPVRPLFILKEPGVNPQTIEDLLQGIPNKDEYIIKS